MADLRAQLESLIRADNGAIRPETVDRARELVEAQGSSPEAVVAFAETFDTWQSRGYAASDVREAFRETYRTLVEQVPEQVLHALDEPQLEARLEALRTLIREYRAEGERLRGELDAANARIAQKQNLVMQLIIQRTQHQETLQNRQLINGALLVFSFAGALGAASKLAGVGAALSMTEVQREISRLNAEIAGAQREQGQLATEAQNYRNRQAELKRRVEALETAEKGLQKTVDEASRARALVRPDDPRGRLVALRDEVSASQGLAENLRDQVDVLRRMLANAVNEERRLDKAISDLEQEIGVLEQRIQQVTRRTLSLFIDLVFREAGIDPKLRLGPFTIDKKRLLLEGIDGLRLSLENQLSTVVDRMIAQGLVEAGASREMASLVLRLIRGTNAREAKPSAVIAALPPERLDALSEPQRFVVDAILRRVEPGPMREGLLARVIEQPAIEDERARALAAIVADHEGDSEQTEEAALAVLDAKKLGVRGAAERVIDYGLGIRFEDRAKDLDAELDKLARVVRRARTFVKTGSPAHEVLTRTIERFDGMDKHDAVADYTMLHAGLDAARVLLAKPRESTALMMLQGWERAIETRKGKGAEAAQARDRISAIEDLVALLPPGDEVRADLEWTLEACKQHPEQAAVFTAEAIERAKLALEPV